MKELLEKFFSAFSDWINLLKDEKSSEAIKKFEEASEMKKDLDTSLEKQENKKEVSEEQIQKFFESDDWKEAIKKYVDIYISANDIGDFLKQFEELKGKLEKLETDKKTDDETIEKALNEHWGEIDEIKKTLLNKRVSKIDCT